MSNKLYRVRSTTKKQEDPALKKFMEEMVKSVVENHKIKLFNVGWEYPSYFTCEIMVDITNPPIKYYTDEKVCDNHIAIMNLKYYGIPEFSGLKR